MGIKEGRLDDSSDIYDKNRKDKITKDKFKNMTFNEKLHFIWFYYGKIIIGAAILLAAILFMTFVMKEDDNDSTFTCTLINGIYLNPDTSEQYLEDFHDYLVNSDTYTGDTNIKRMYFKSYTDSIDDMVMLSYEEDNAYVDVMVMQKDTFISYGENGKLANLKEVLPAELYDKVKDKIVTAKDISTGKVVECGIELGDDVELYNENGEPQENTVLSIMTYTKHMDAAVEYIKFISEGN